MNGVGGTTAGDDLVVHIVDDTPAFGSVQSQQTDNIIGASYIATGTLHFTPGADGFGSVTGITSSTTAKSGGHSLVYSPLSGGVLSAYQDANDNGQYDAGTDTVKVFTLSANPTAVPPGAPSTDHAGTYTFQLLTPLDPTITPTQIGGSSGFGAGPTGEQQLNGSSSTQHLAIIDGWSTSASTLASAFNQATWTQQSVNSSVAGFGINNNNLDSGELFIADFHNQNAPGITLPAGQSNPFGPQIAFATFTFSGFGANDKVYYQSHYEDGTLGAITQVDPTKFSSGVTVNAAPGEYLDYIVFYDQSGNGKFNLTNTGTVSSTVNQQINFTLSASDGDTDVATTSTFHVTVATGAVPSSPVAPVVLDLDGNGLQFVPISSGVTFDYQGDGHALATAWAGVGDGVLALQSGSGFQVVFGGNGLSDLQGLAAQFDSNHDGLLDAHDASWSQFGALVTQANGSELFETLTQLGVSSIKLTSDGISYSAANGDVTVLGEASFERTDGSKGTVGDALFATAKDGDYTKPADTTASSINQALLAASLVAVAGATETVEQQPAPTVTESHTTVSDPVPTTTTSASDPTSTTDAAPATVASTEDQTTHTADQPVDQSSHGGEDPTPQHATLADAADAHAAVSSAPAEPAQPDLGTHQGLLAQSINLPAAFDGNAAALVAAAHAAGPAGQVVAQVVAEALGAHDAPHIDALLAALPGGDHAPAPMLLNPVAAEVVDTGHFAAAAAAVFEAAMVAHEAMAVAHA